MSPLFDSTLNYNVCYPSPRQNINYTTVTFNNLIYLELNLVINCISNLFRVLTLIV